MIRRFCDVCDNELTSKNEIAGGTGRLQRLSHESAPGKAGKVMFEVTTGIANGTWNSGDFCKYCVIDAINKLDDRPREGRA